MGQAAPKDLADQIAQQSATQCQSWRCANALTMRRQTAGPKTSCSPTSKVTKPKSLSHSNHLVTFTRYIRIYIYIYIYIYVHICVYLCCISCLLACGNRLATTALTSLPFPLPSPSPSLALPFWETVN